MATQICPNCKSDSFTWIEDEDEAPLVRWRCYACCYIAYEDEAYERVCSNCDKKSESKLVDSEKTYWWCSNCNRITLNKES